VARVLFFWDKFDYGVSRNSPKGREVWLILNALEIEIRERMTESLVRKKEELERQS